MALIRTAWMAQQSRPSLTTPLRARPGWSQALPTQTALARGRRIPCLRHSTVDAGHLVSDSASVSFYVAGAIAQRPAASRLVNQAL